MQARKSGASPITADSSKKGVSCLQLIIPAVSGDAPLDACTFNKINKNNVLHISRLPELASLAVVENSCRYDGHRGNGVILRFLAALAK